MNEKKWQERANLDPWNMDHVGSTRVNEYATQMVHIMAWVWCVTKNNPSFSLRWVGY